VAAALACRAVLDVAVVTDDPAAAGELATLGARIVPDTPAAGLNAALAHGARTVRAIRPGAPVAALNADLPALQPEELARVLDAAEEFPRAFLADAAKIGTTLLAAGPGTELNPAFGGPSRHRHLSSGAVEIVLPGVDSVRRDVDTGDDLLVAMALGLGPHTAARYGAYGPSPAPEGRGLPGLPRPPDGPVLSTDRYAAGMQATAYTYESESRSGSVLLDDGTPVDFDAAAFEAGGLRLLRPGQRVRIETEGEGASRRITLVTLQTF
jgi:2-phospho-L-lactate guanylyltransferase